MIITFCGILAPVFGSVIGDVSMLFKQSRRTLIFSLSAMNSCRYFLYGDEAYLGPLGPSYQPLFRISAELNILSAISFVLIKVGIDGIVAAKRSLLAYFWYSTREGLDR